LAAGLAPHRIITPRRYCFALLLDDKIKSEELAVGASSKNGASRWGDQPGANLGRKEIRKGSAEAGAQKAPHAC
jgi:hypothetical protein